MRWASWALILVAAPAALAAPTEDLATVQPGAPLLNGCTMGWLLTDGDHVYVTTAAHCTAPDARLAVPDGTEVATVILWNGGPVGHDFAIARVDDGVPFAAEMAHFGHAWQISPGGAPNGVLQYYGWGEETMADHRTRARVGPELVPPIEYLAFAGGVSAGDSGAPLRSVAGLAAGIITHRLEIDPGAVEPLVGGAGTPLARIAEAAEGRGLSLRLVNDPLGAP